MTDYLIPYDIDCYKFIDRDWYLFIDKERNVAVVYVVSDNKRCEVQFSMTLIDRKDFVYDYISKISTQLFKTIDI